MYLAICAAASRPDADGAPATVVGIVWEVIKHRDWWLVNGTLKSWARRLWEWTKPGQYLDRVGGTGIGCASGASLGGAAG